MTVFDAADWFLSKQSLTHKKLQKLCYYFKAWGLALYDTDFMPGYEFQAWVHGPVNPELYQKYKDYGWNDIPMINGSTFPYDEKQIDIFESVQLSYGDMSANALEVQTHIEEPWRITRKGYGEYDNCTPPIPNEVMRDYYRALYQQQGE